MLADALDLLRRPQASAAELRAALDSLSAPDAEREVDAIEAERRRILLDGTDADLATIETRISAACRTLERTTAAIDELQRRLAETERAEGDAERRARHERARKASADAAKRLGPVVI